MRWTNTRSLSRRIVARYPAHAVAVDDPGVLVDIDTPEDLMRARDSERLLRSGVA